MEGLKEPDEIDEDEVDSRVFGNIFHRSAELFYLHFASPEDLEPDYKGDLKLKHSLCITQGDLANALKDKLLVDRIVEQAFREELFKVDKQDYRPKYNGLQLINREVIINYLQQLISNDRRLAPFYILGLEQQVTTTIEVQTRNGEKKMRIGGMIDRLDAVAANGNPGMDNLMERIRVIDYKTGHAPTQHPAELSEVFCQDSKVSKKHSDYYLQSMLYSIIVRRSRQLNPSNNPVSPGLLFIQKAGAEDYAPMLKMGRKTIEDVAEYEQDFWANLKNILNEIYDKRIPFSPTDERDRCETCPYAALCH